MTKKRNILATSALIYANGPVHLGHMVEYIQTDIWVRFQKMRGNDCLYICGNDAHGTPIMLSAQKQNISPKELIDKIYIEHQQDFADFLVEFDNFYTTDSPENKTLVNEIYEKLRTNGDIETKVILQAYDEKMQMFLPDRYVKGECPRCGAKDQYGDNCEVCGSTYTPMDLKNPISVLSNTAPVTKESMHYFFNLLNYEKFLRQWLQENRLQEQMVHKLNEWFTAGLKPWDISRDQPYFGFSIPNAPDKYFYVWLDAPVGYMASLKNLCSKKPELSFDAYWNENSDTELYHFVGKDIVYFHALFWPAMLHGAHFRTPTAIFVHGFLTVNGQKMSKSRGTFITARQYLAQLNPEYLRYYFAAKLSNRVEDIDLNFEDFMQRINSDLVGKVVNIASRCASFINKLFQGQLAASVAEPALIEKFVVAGDEIAELYESRDYQRAVRSIMALADLANQYIDDKKPWVLAKQTENSDEVQQVCTMGLNLFYILMIYLKPILPNIAAASEKFLNIESVTWESRKQLLINHRINTFTPLMQRITQEQIAAVTTPNTGLTMTL